MSGSISPSGLFCPEQLLTARRAFAQSKLVAESRSHRRKRRPSFAECRKPLALRARSITYGLRRKSRKNWLISAVTAMLSVAAGQTEAKYFQKDRPRFKRSTNSLSG